KTMTLSFFITVIPDHDKPQPPGCLLEYNSGILNRLDRLTAANYGMPINSNLCINKFVNHKDKSIMLQAASIYTQGDGREWDSKIMFEIMFDISTTSLRVLGRDLFEQLTSK
ncbi:EcoRI family type II restriction endonuclease, partial [Escherichia coli]|uniref:EcoRI family type II restriction endonuclease n=1 Tax=Escherichia coli TaxID=562 RepID=UPI002377E4BA